MSFKFTKVKEVEPFVIFVNSILKRFNLAQKKVRKQQKLFEL